MDGYKELAAAIVERALMDFRTARNNIRKNYNIDYSEKTILEVSQFLMSEWFTMISDLNGCLLLKMMKEEMA